MLSTEAQLSQSKLSNFVVFVGLMLVLILHPLEALAMSPLNRCGNILRATSLRTRLALLGLGGAGLGLMTLPVTHAFEQYANTRALRSLEKSSGDNVVGARYAQDLVTAGVLTPFRAQSLVTAYNVSLRESLRPLQMRIAQYRKLTLWTPAQAQVAFRALDHISKVASPLKSLNNSSLRAQLIEDPSFKSMIQSLPESQNFTWSLLTEPTIFVDGRSDAAWLALFFKPDQHVGDFTDSELAALTSLQSLYATHDPGLTLPMLTKMISDSFGKTDDLEEKQQQARELGLSGPFIYRADNRFSRPRSSTTILTAPRC